MESRKIVKLILREFNINTIIEMNRWGLVINPWSAPCYSAHKILSSQAINSKSAHNRKS